ncbi:hypothetical protein BKA93DRAFT_798601, partial [Sparassis latifolia]
MPVSSLSRRPMRCNSGALPPPHGRLGPSKPHHTPPHFPAACFGPLRRAQVDHGERRHRSDRVSHRGGATALTSLLALSRPRRWPASPPSTIP